MERKNFRLIGLSLASIFMASAFPKFVSATSLQLGADYMLRGVSITERDKNFKSTAYYDQKIQAYLSTSLSKDVEATIKIQSLSPWGMESSTTPIDSIYPNANGEVWVQNGYIRLPNIWKKRAILTVGRQPIQWGEGEILSDNDAGMNAIRAQIKSPFRWLPIDLDGFTAKVEESLRQKEDTDLHGVQLGFDRDYVRWDLMGLWENDKSNQDYMVGAGTVPFAATQVERVIYGIRAKANLKDAYMFGSYYVQGGTIKKQDATADVKLGGSAFQFGLGGRQENKVIGRVGAFLDYSEATGDKPSTGGDDEAFRPTFASRWSGLERVGKGRYFAATFSDAYSPSDSFAPATTMNTGLPEGTSGIQTAHFGLEFNPWAPWLFNFDYYQYKAVNNISGPKELGTEFDYSVAYQYSGLVSFKLTTNDFNPGEAFKQIDPNNPLAETTAQKAKLSTIEIQIKF